MVSGLREGLTSAVRNHGRFEPPREARGSGLAGEVFSPLRRRLCRAREGLEPFASWYSASLNALWYTFLERVSPGPFQKCDHLETSTSVQPRTSLPKFLTEAEGPKWQCQGLGFPFS